MKNSNLYRMMNSGSFFPAFILLYIACFWGCKKDELIKFSTDLAINSRIVRLADSAATTRILVYSDNDWSVKTVQDAPWVTFDRTSGSGKSEFQATVTSNQGELPRAVKIVISSGSKTDTVDLQQKGLTPAISITDATAVGIAGGGDIKTAIATNVPFDLMTKTVTYGDNEQGNWISDINIKDDYLHFTMAASPSSESREAVLKLSYKDALGTTTIDSIIISQNPKGGYDNAVLKDFAYVKNSLATGTITEDIYVEGIVVSDKGNPNMGLNPNLAGNKHALDKTENAITVYLQSPDGRSGLHIRTKTPGDNMFYRNEQVKLWLKGGTLSRQSNPSAVTISDIQSINIMEKTERTAPLTAREVYMKDLTDDDLYTYIKLKDVEISVPSGSFTNINEGYVARMNVYPLNVRDIYGSSMYMLTNLDVPYRRDGTQVPQGSGTISGILVNENLPRYGGNIGKYAIRQVSREDIALDNARENGFSDILVQWTRYKTEYAASPTADANPLTPDIGSGTLTQSETSPLNFTSSGIYAGVDYNGLLQEPTTVKGSVPNGAWTSKNWWNVTENRGAWWLIHVSTAGISTPVSLQVEGNSDIGGPRNFVVEWSASSDVNGTWNQVGEYTLEDVANWSNTLLTQVAGLKVVNFQFPVTASGLPDLYIRLRVKNKQAGTQTSATAGTLAASGASRLGYVAIKYNK